MPTFPGGKGTLIQRGQQTKGTLYYFYEMSQYQLSVVLPLSHEGQTITALLEKILTADLPGIAIQVIVVEEEPATVTGETISRFSQLYPIHTVQYIRLEKNSGQGKAVQKGIEAATGDFILIQEPGPDFDNSYYPALLQPVLDNKADVVYGNRYRWTGLQRIPNFWQQAGNKLLNRLSAMFSNLALGDSTNGYKLFKASILQSITLGENGQGWEQELTAKLAAIPGIRVYETPVAGTGKQNDTGNKWWNGLKSFYTILRYNLFDTKEKLSSFQLNPAIATILLFFIAGVILIFTASGTSDEGDSVMHFLYARDAFQYPAHFLNQWAKPVYVLVTAPVAQFGFNAVKFFNLVLITCSLWLTYKTAKRLHIANAWMVPLLAAFAPLLMIITLSGLTEPLFAFWLIAGIYGLLQGKKTISLLWLSFLPLVRSEGLIILSVLLVYLLVKKYYRFIPLLIAGQLIYSIAGLSLYKDPLWIFKTLSYATLSSAYGKGEWTHFIKSMPIVVGIPLLILAGMGLLYGAFLFCGRYFFRDKKITTDEELFLVYGCALAVFIGHSAFWALGIFNSMGLIRVLVGVLPLIALISLRGLNTITDIIRSNTLRYIILASVIIFPFIGTNYSFHWKRDFSLKADQAAEVKMADYIKKNYPDYKNYVFYFEACWNSVVLDINYFDESKHKRFLGAFEKNEFPDKCFLVWDDWFARVEGRVELQQLLDDTRFELVGSFDEKDVWGVTRTVKLFRKK